MASDWIKMRVDLHRDPAVISIARACRLDAYAVVGRLHAVWAWADSITADGLLPGMDLDVIDQIANRKGFGQAMTATPGTPWLVERDGGLEVPLFGRHNGQSAKSRALARDRKVAERDRSSRPRTHAVTLAGGQASRTKRDASVTREEKRREREENYGKLLPAADAAGPGSAKPRRAPSGPVQELLAWFRDEYERLRGSPYVIAARDGVAVAKALKTFDAGELQARLARGLELEDDAFIANSDRGLAFLVGQVNRPSLRGIGPAAPRTSSQSATSQVKTIAAVTERLIREEQNGQG